MTSEKKAANSKKFRKLDLWLFHYLNENSSTLLNAAASVRAAGYNCSTDESVRSIGYENLTNAPEYSSLRSWIEIGSGDRSMSKDASKNITFGFTRGGFMPSPCKPYGGYVIISSIGNICLPCRIVRIDTWFFSIR
jgi:hypothetical protein